MLRFYSKNFLPVFIRAHIAVHLLIDRLFRRHHWLKWNIIKKFSNPKLVNQKTAHQSDWSLWSSRRRPRSGRAGPAAGQRPEWRRPRWTTSGAASAAWSTWWRAGAGAASGAPSARPARPAAPETPRTPRPPRPSRRLQNKFCYAQNKILYIKLKYPPKVFLP